MTTLSIILLAVIVVETIALVILFFMKRRFRIISVPCEIHDSDYSPYRFSEEDQKQIHEFEDKHWHEVAGPTAGDRFSYIFCPTGIGMIKRVKCNYCGEELDLSELD